jgi:DNA invertase Pin-like site-specific DNA recombinase
MKLRVAAYARVSTESEEQIYALSNQIHYYNEEIKKRDNWELYNIYVDEGLSGTSTKKRPEFLKMIEDAKKGFFDIIITREVSRFARNIIDALQFTRQLKDCGVFVFFIMDNINTGDGDGELRLSLMATLAQEESRKLSSRVKEGIVSSMKQGNFKSGRPYGYAKNTNEDDYHVVESEAKVVKFIFERYLNGYGLRHIKCDLETKGMLTPRGQKQWCESTISRILKNKFYCGYFEYHKVYRPDFLKQNLKKNNGDIPRIKVKGSHEIIVTEEEFLRVQEILKGKTIDDLKGKNKSKYVWSGIVFCGVCGSPFRRNQGRKRKDGTVSNYYICSRRRDNGTVKKRMEMGTEDIKGCDNKYITEETLYENASFIVKKILSNKKNELKEIEKIILESLNDVDYKKLIDETEFNIEKLNQKMQKLLDLYLEGGVGKNAYDTKKKELNKTIEEETKLLEERKSKFGDSNKKLEKFNKIKDFIDTEINFEERLSDEIISAFFKRIEILPCGGLNAYLNMGVREENEVNVSDRGGYCKQNTAIKHVKGLRNRKNPVGLFV